MGLKARRVFDFYRVGYFVVEKNPHHDARFAWVSQPKRSCRHLLLDHLNLNGGCHDVLLDGKHERFRSLEDITQCRRVGHFGCSRTLLLHARVLDHHRHVSDPLSVHRLVDHCSFANGRILLHSHRSQTRPWSRNVLPLVFGNMCDVGFRLFWRGAFPQRMGRILIRLGGWGFILFEIFAGEAGKESAALGGNVKTAFDIMKFIVTVGWSIYPLGYFFGYLQSGVDDSTLNLVYNLADFVNKIAFCLAIWNCAKNDTAEKA